VLVSIILSLFGEYRMMKNAGMGAEIKIYRRMPGRLK